MQHSFYKRQQGFTLLELLVVITLLAVLSVGALVAYDGVGDNAQATAATSNTASVDQIAHTYRAVTGNYPNQWDNLSVGAAGGGAPAILADATKSAFGQWNPVADAATWSAVATSLEQVGIVDLQSINTTAANVDVAPNLQHNEGANPAKATEVALWDETNETPVAAASAPTFISIMPSGGATGTCGAGTAAAKLSDTYDATALTTSNILNKINDSLAVDACHLVLALGFGHDAAHSTANSSVAVASAPTYSSKKVNPTNNYARYVALFHMGTDGILTNGTAGGATANVVEAIEINKKPRLIAVVDTEGNDIDTNAAAMSATN